MVKANDGRCVLSWDDGPIEDLRLAEMLARHGLTATFFVPITNREGRSTMTAADLRLLASGGFEIGSHTHDHVYLDSCDEATGRQQILDGRKALENVLGAEVTGFCYPGGKKGKGYTELLKQHSFSYGRTIRNFRMDAGDAAFQMPVTLQFYPHSSPVLMKNACTLPVEPERLIIASQTCLRASVEERVNFLITKAASEGRLLHIWGHSWELDLFEGWQMLDRVCAQLAATGLKSITAKMAITGASHNG